MSDPTARDLRRFRRTLAVSISILGVLCLVSVWFSVFQAPRLSSAQVDTAAVIARPHQQLRLFGNQALAHIRPGQVTVTPAEPFTVTTRGDVIAVQFSEPLHYGTAYAVTVAGVTSVYQDRPTTFEYEFTTNAATLYFLDRAGPAAVSDTLDSIVRTGVSGSGRTDLYRARHIIDFVVVGDVIAVVTQNDRGSDSVTLVSISSGATEVLELPDIGVVGQLAGAPDAGVIGFTLSSLRSPSTPTPPKYSNALFTVDLTSVHVAAPVLGVAGAPLQALEWFFLPNSSELVIQSDDGSVLMTGATGPARPSPLGQYVSLGSPSEDGREIVVGDIYGPLALSLVDGATRRLPVAPLGGMLPAGGEVRLTGSGPAAARVQQVAIFDAGSGRFSTYVVAVQGGKAHILYQPADAHGSIEGFSISPNGQYLAVATIPDVRISVSDGYLRNAQSTSVTTVFIAVATGAVVRSVEGFDVRW